MTERVRKPYTVRMGPQHWRVVAKIVRAIKDPKVRYIVANHFAQEMAKEGNSHFDPGHWNGETGGRLTGPVTLEDLKVRILVDGLPLKDR